MRSATPGVVWPPLPGEEGRLLAALLAQLEQLQWWSPEAIEAAQWRQLQVLLAHARRHSPYYRERLADGGIDKAASLAECLGQLPLLGRADLQAHGATIPCATYPPQHGRMAENRSSGSTGEPVTVKRTELNQLMWMAMTLREHLWQRRNFREPLAVIRTRRNEPDAMGPPLHAPDWGAPVNTLFDSGPALNLNVRADLDQLASWLRPFAPGYLLTYPNVLNGLLDIAEAKGPAHAGLHRLLQARTLGETVSPSLRQRCQTILGIGIGDTYSTQEIGAIAIECPDGDAYHVMGEGAIVEVLREDGTACAPGETGRVVATDLHNFAMPMIRYSLGDYAELGQQCACGRGLPSIRRFLGRERNLLRYPDGRRVWPPLWGMNLCEVAPVRQFQMIQPVPEGVVLRIFPDRPVRADEEAGMRERVERVLGYPFAVSFEYVDQPLPRGAGGKFEEFRCEIS